jgi:hypothetical protein
MALALSNLNEWNVQQLAGVSLRIRPILPLSPNSRIPFSPSPFASLEDQLLQPDFEDFMYRDKNESQRYVKYNFEKNCAIN